MFMMNPQCLCHTSRLFLAFLKVLQPWLALEIAYIYITTLSHLRSKGEASIYIAYCTGSGMLTRYTHT